MHTSRSVSKTDTLSKLLFSSSRVIYIRPNAVPNLDLGWGGGGGGGGGNKNLRDNRIFAGLQGQTAAIKLLQWVTHNLKKQETANKSDGQRNYHRK